jgi:ABC-type uncharacterized transport system substrate-binding protein
MLDRILAALRCLVPCLLGCLAPLGSHGLAAELGHASIHSGLSMPAAGQASPISPKARPDGQRWRIGWLASGSFEDYPASFAAMVLGLEELGWLKLDAPLPEKPTEQALWNFLARHVQSSYLFFVPDAFWTEGYASGHRASVREILRKRLGQVQDIDLMLASGTWAGQDMMLLGAPVPTIVMDASDPVGAGIVDSVEDSGLDNLHAPASPGRFRQQARFFHQVVPFKKLGVVYEDSFEGRTYAGIAELEAEAADSKFALIACVAPNTGFPRKEIEKGAYACYEKLAKEVDAMLITYHRGTEGKAILPVAALLRRAKIPSFSLLRTKEVEDGILMSMAPGSYSDIGLFYATGIARIFNGEKPRALSQAWMDAFQIAFNIETTRQIGFDPPFEFLIAIDKIYGAPDWLFQESQASQSK